MDTLDYFINQKIELKNITDELIRQIDLQQDINIQPLENFLYSFQDCLENSSTLVSLTDHLIELQDTISNSIHLLSEKCQAAQHQLFKMDQRHQGMRAYAQNQFLSFRKVL